VDSFQVVRIGVIGDKLKGSAPKEKAKTAVNILTPREATIWGGAQFGGAVKIGWGGTAIDSPFWTPPKVP